ncbi:hypothetical protein JCM19240_1358 [Vibrio maritimus]|uniref:Uncharacterized protein n=1 Tax=Vibrio maritimus TaxID=990268 RepID=A0A090U3A2_9VIBR|nr:hypothetical protein JCM19240_1358 [Vibrio maritimus]
MQVTTKAPIAAINALTQARYTQREGWYSKVNWPTSRK